MVNNEQRQFPLQLILYKESWKYGWMIFYENVHDKQIQKREIQIDYLPWEDGKERH